jgi:molecular chaperone IbpA
MRTDFDFAPYYRGTVGFDRIFDLLGTVASQPSDGGYPPYDIEKTGDNSWRIVMAVAGFNETDLSITQKEDELLVMGKMQQRPEQTEILYRGIAGREFERRFQLADHVKVTGARMVNGLLSIDLHRELPEEKKPRTIRIDTGAAPKTITQR